MINPRWTRRCASKEDVGAYDPGRWTLSTGLLDVYIPSVHPVTKRSRRRGKF